MKKFIKNVIILFSIVLICMASLVAFDRFVIGPQYQRNYQASLIDKVARLESISEPKIVLVGHSNLSFGINSEMIETEIGMPVVNLGLHGGLGNAFHEEIAKLNINEGDIVIVCHSAFNDDDTIGNPSLAWITYDWNESIAPIIREKDYLSMIRAYPTYFKSTFLLWIKQAGNEETDDCYTRSAFNKYGDVVYKPAEGQMDVDEFFKVTDVPVPQINDICTERLNELNEYCENHGATLLIAGYPIAYGQYSTFTKDDFIEFKNNLSQKLDCTIISDYTDYFYPYSYFYNTNLHLTTEGANIRTQQLIDDIKAWQNSEK